MSNDTGQHISSRQIQIMVNAMNAIQDMSISGTAKDYEWESRTVGNHRMYSLKRGGKVLIQGMRAGDFYFACNAIAETMNDVVREFSARAYHCDECMRHA